jgi:hypothetical protein
MKDFTSQQKEIVARKLGYDGPMQGFDEFIASSPALEARYSAITGKFAERMAKGGLVKMKRYADGGVVDPELVIDPVAQKAYADKVAADNAYVASKLTADTITNTANIANAPNTTVGVGGAGTATGSPIQGAAGPTLVPTGAGVAPNIPTATGVVSTQEIKDYLANNPNLTDAQIAAKMNEYKVTPDQMATATGLNSSEIQNRYNIATGAGGVTTGTVGTTDEFGKPVAGTASQVKAAQLVSGAGQTLSTTPIAGTKAGQVTGATTATAGQATATQAGAATTYTADQAAANVAAGLKGFTGAKGTVSTGAQMTGQTSVVGEKAVAGVQKFDEANYIPVEAATRTVGADELITGATGGPAVTAGVETTATPEAVAAKTRQVQADELATAVTISEENMAKATAIVADGLNADAKAVAQRLEKFTVTDETLAQAAQGNVEAMSTVQGQLTSLMKSFDDGKTPAWAAGAIRAANAAMSSRGLGNSSMAGAAIFQAAMESALPIAQQDAQTFANMGLSNLNNRQQVSLANAAAQQGLSLANLNNEQQVALQNSANSFSLQSQNLSNQQQVVLANAQIKASLQGQNLSNQQQTAIANAARYAEVNNINLSNEQQTALFNSSQKVQVDLANTSNKQQTALANAQIASALQMKELDNKQQAAVLNAAKYAEANNLTYTADQQAKLQNSQLMQSIGIANLNAAQTTTIANAATYAAMDLANLNNRQQAAVTNAKAFLETDLANLSNEQQASVIKAQATTQALLADTAQANAAKQFNASSENQVTQFNATLATQVSQTNAAQVTAINQFNAGETNSINKFNTEAQNQRDTFNAQQRLVIDQSNAQWQRDIATANTAATNATNITNAQLTQQVTLAEYNNNVQMYRDDVAHAWQSSENDANRSTTLAASEIAKEGQLAIANATIEAGNASAIGNFAAKAIGNSTIVDKALTAIGTFLLG